jgi:hypothetical protein
VKALWRYIRVESSPAMATSPVWLVRVCLVELMLLIFGSRSLWMNGVPLPLGKLMLLASGAVL